MALEATTCGCERPSLNIVHQFGAMVYCKACGLRGPWVPGTNYQTEERAAIRAWNDSRPPQSIVSEQERMK